MGKAMCAKRVKNRKKSKKSSSKVAQKLVQNSVRKPAVILESVDVKAEADKRLQETKVAELQPDMEDATEELIPSEESTEKVAKEADLNAELIEEKQLELVEDDQKPVENKDKEVTSTGNDQKSVEYTDEDSENDKENNQRSVKAKDEEIKAAEKDDQRSFKLFPVLWWILGAAAIVLVGVGVAWALGAFSGNTEVADDGSVVDVPVEEEDPAKDTLTTEEPAEEPEELTKEPEPQPELPKKQEEPVTPIAPRPGNEADPEVTPGSKVIALTFDDGPSAATTPRLLDILQGRGVKATFFVLGTMAQRAPGILQREAAEGHEVASHTPYHNQLTNLTPAQVRAEAVEMDRIFTEILGAVPPFTRPPYGSFNAAVGEALGQPMVLWSIDPRDWADRNASVVCSRVVGAAKDGAIILVHDIHATTVDAVPCIIDTLRAQGYEFLTVSELAAAKDVPLVSGAAYYNF